MIARETNAQLPFFYLGSLVKDYMNKTKKEKIIRNCICSQTDNYISNQFTKILLQTFCISADIKHIPTLGR